MLWGRAEGRKNNVLIEVEVETTLGRKEGFGLQTNLSMFKTRKGSLQKRAASSDTHLTDPMATIRATL